MSDDLHKARIGLLRLKRGQSTLEVEASLREQSPHLVGSLLSWLRDD
ncbi:MAG: hypothetical protein ING40_00820 [Burkholderiales bacterium]|jgi:hypothetical protein|nr:hypothetical protein [Burkholderiales bacterium]